MWARSPVPNSPSMSTRERCRRDEYLAPAAIISSMPEVEDYLASLAPDEREAFERVCGVVRRVVPDVEEGRSYAMPAFKYEGRPLLGITAAKAHLSVFPFSSAAVDAVRDSLVGFSLSKGTIPFHPEQPIPKDVLERLLRHRMAEIDARPPRR